MIGECVAVLVDALLPLRTSVGELARDRGDPSTLSGDGGWLLEDELTGEAGVEVGRTCVGGGDGVRGRVVVEGLCFATACIVEGAERTIDGR